MNIDNSAQPYEEFHDINENQEDVPKSAAFVRPKLRHLMLNDLIVNFTVVTIPACFTNTSWRLMNLYGIAVSHNSGEIILDTAYEIATVILLICFIIDLCRQFITAYKSGNNFSNISVSKSFLLGIKFFLGCIGWTMGYVMVAEDHQIYAEATWSHLAAHAVGASLGSFCGLFFACEMINYLQKYVIHRNNKEYEIIDHRSSVGVATKGILEAILWSILGDLNFYNRFNDDNKDANNICDALIVGIVASLGYSIMGLFTTVFRWYYTRSYYFSLFNDVEETAAPSVELQAISK